MATNNQTPSPRPSTTGTPLPTLACRKWPSQSSRAATIPSPKSPPQFWRDEMSQSPLLVVTPPPQSPSSQPQPQSEPHPQPHPLPHPSPPRRRDHRAKTQREKARGKRLEEAKIGVDAETPCACCRRRLQRWSKTRGDESSKPRCCVPRDPVAFDSYKCGYCIGSKGKCSFSVDNPGAKFEPETLHKTLLREGVKRASRKKAVETRRRQSGWVPAGGEG
ncbi:hypothetical protein F5B18DRAFT_673882 [Nemania serpens]|nr:hypothetical protein F5B18DRAFT_673882 [Nemania serpens]